VATAPVFMAVDYTDGRTTETVRFDPHGDTEATVARITDQMAKDGFIPVKGSARMTPVPGAFKAPADPMPHFLDVKGPSMFRTKRSSIRWA
jgi:hypothetical protein